MCVCLMCDTNEQVASFQVISGKKKNLRESLKV